MENGFIEWHAHEHIRTEKSSDWYWAVGIIAISAAVTAIIFNDILFAIVILLGTFVMTMHAVKEPPLRHYMITSRGVRIDNVFYPYQNLDSFWVDDDFYPAKLLIKSKKLFMPLLVLPLADDMDPDIVRSFMDEYLPAVIHREPFLYKLLEHFGF
jgi:hypothetical protein